MKTKTIITEITKDDLVTLFADAMYDSHIFLAKYPTSFYNENVYDKNDCKEERIAKCLLAGQYISIYDMCGTHSDNYGILVHQWDDMYSSMRYVVSLKHIECGLQSALDGTFKSHNEDEVKYVRKCIYDLINDGTEWDAIEAQDLFQIILFNELIYS